MNIHWKDGTEAEASILRPLDENSQFLEKILMIGKIEHGKRKG